MTGRVLAPSSARWEVFRALGALTDTASPAVATALGIEGLIDPADHTEVFTFHALPYASVYLGADGMLGGESADRVAGFWRALGYPDSDRPDHLAGLLGLYAALGEQEEAEGDLPRRIIVRQARLALLWEHLLPWTGLLCDVVRTVGSSPWVRWAELVDKILMGEAEDRPNGLPLHLRSAPPPLDDPLDVRGLLTPVRTGVIITRVDLARGARSLGLGVRLTGRVPTLEALFDQARDEMVAWLADHARAWEDRHRRRLSALGPIGEFWVGRAASTKSILDKP